LELLRASDERLAAIAGLLGAVTAAGETMGGTMAGEMTAGETWGDATVGATAPSPLGGVRGGPPAVDVGELVGGRFRIQAVIGRGSSADVYEALDEATGQRVALKVVRYMTAATLDAVRFDLERDLLAGLRHENLVGFVDSGADRRHVWLAMRLVTQGTLAAAPRPMELRPVAQIGLQVSRALAYVHARGVIHRDVKPANILLDGEVERVYLAVFGIAREHGDPNLTETGLVLGTAAYLSPEQVRGEPATTACDIFSLGLVMLECLTGRREYPGSLVEAAVARLHRPPDVSVIEDDVMRDLLRWMTAPNPLYRPDAATVVDCLESALAADQTGDETFFA
jgi:serine/threonine protein kinase